ncbi:MAG: preprotein translocase subunit SecA [Parachlamydiales bacterium]|jgi:preprotein translocase subunit SecA
MFDFLKWIFGSAQDRAVRSYRKLVEQINAEDEKLKQLSDEQVIAKTEEFKVRLKKGETLDQILPEAFAVVKNACRRLCGTEVHVSGYNQKWDMVPFDVQLIGAIALHKGSVAEMQTGEGKTLTALMPLYLNALTGRPVHLVTVNDYLAKRDCEWVGFVLRWLGLTTGALTNDVQLDQKHALYACDVLYGTAAEFGFDYLRDNSMAMRKEDQVQRGFFFAIIDEADSILIDEARTPLIISGPVPESRQMYDQLKDRVAELVKMQRDLCNRWGNDARKVLEKGKLLGDETRETQGISKEQLAEEDEALRKLWLVGKGNPRNKIVKKAKENPDLRAAIDNWDLYYYSDTNKQEKAQTLAELYLTVDEKTSDFELTDKGSQAWQDISGEDYANDFVMMDISEEYHKIDEDTSLDPEAKVQRKLAVQADDALRKERSHNLRQLLRAHILMEKDVDYIVMEGKIIIIDENTGRPQPGRRFSDGLHQAIEAKEGVEIQEETQTYATITLQNFFRMYEKLAGMTGTAGTEAGELKSIYKLDVLVIPTHKTCIRNDANDEIYMTEREKYNAILKEIRDVHTQGRPILIGTESVEVSEKLSRIFKQNNLPHTILNAKYHEKEAEIIANAGQQGAITISTNMAGRGTDIKLGDGINTLGGLHVVGTTRHQSRRIDRQLRGRSARQGDPGSSKFFISFEDQLLRLFASPRITSILQRFRPPEGEPISASILNKSIETAQKRVEQRNFTVRKHTIDYDDVMNKQRQEIYAFRNDILHTNDIISLAEEVIQTACNHAAMNHFRSRAEEGGWDPEGFRLFLMQHFPITFEENYFDIDRADAEELEGMAAEVIIKAFHEKIQRENGKVPTHLLAPGAPPPAEAAIRNLMIRKNDELWQEHLLAMDHLRAEVNLRSLGNRDPLLEFKHEAFRMFEEYSKNLYADIANGFFRFQIVLQEAPPIDMLLRRLQLETQRSLADEMDAQPSEQQVSESAQSSTEQPVVAGPKTGRNDLCPCGSGKKYKKCCGQDEAE